MKKILILGGTGMLGYGVVKSFLESKDFGDYKIYITGRPKALDYVKNTETLLEKYKNLAGAAIFDAHNKDFETLFSLIDGKPDFIINCIGIIKPHIDKDHYSSVYINGAFPHLVSKWCELNNIKLIHITTDCVFSGKKGNYTEDDDHDVTDLYGRSKSLGEPDNCMVLRTSIIGPEIHEPASLLSWAISQKDKQVNGFTNHLWNGVTTVEYGKICKKIIDNDLHENIKYHIFNPTPHTKLEMLKHISKKYDLNLKIKPTKASEKCVRTLASKYDFYKLIGIEPFYKQLEEL